MTICANCGQPTSDVYHVDGRTVGGCCWDPFGTLEQVGERRSANGVDEREDAMLGAHLKMRAAQGAGAGNSNDSSGLTTLDELDWSSDRG